MLGQRGAAPHMLVEQASKPGAFVVASKPPNKLPSPLPINLHRTRADDRAHERRPERPKAERIGRSFRDSVLRRKTHKRPERPTRSATAPRRRELFASNWESQENPCA